MSISFLLFFFCSQAQNEVKSTISNSNTLSKVIVYLKENVSVSNEFQVFLNQNNANLKRAISISDDKINFLSKEAIRISNSDYYVQKLKRIYTVEFTVQPNDFAAFIEKMKSFSDVEYGYEMNTIPVKPPTDIAPTTSNFEANQTYLGADPGINM